MQQRIVEVPCRQGTPIAPPPRARGSEAHGAVRRRQAAVIRRRPRMSRALPNRVPSTLPTRAEAGRRGRNDANSGGSARRGETVGLLVRTRWCSRSAADAPGSAFGFGLAQCPRSRATARWRPPGANRRVASPPAGLLDRLWLRQKLPLCHQHADVPCFGHRRSYRWEEAPKRFLHSRPCGEERLGHLHGTQVAVGQ